MRALACALAGLAALAAAGGAGAADQPRYEPQGAWVRPLPLPLQAKPDGEAAQRLLMSIQTQLAAGGADTFMEAASRINAPSGLEQANSLTLTWNPLTDAVAIHRARLIRAGAVIDLLAGQKRFAVLRREPNLEAAMIDGELTATLQPEGVRVGDVVDFAYTLSRREPALAGHAESDIAVGHAGSIGRLFVRASWPDARPVKLWRSDDLPALAPATAGGETAVELDQAGAVSPEPPQGAFSYDRLFGLLSFSDFRDWAEVSATAYPLYARAATLAPDSPLKAEIARIAAAHPDAPGRTLAALKLVEGQTRYFFTGLDAGGYTPAPADVTWSRRFGDCKGKTVLLLALLHGLGVQAEPVLVNTAFGDGLDRERPQMSAFDHVLVRATLGGRDTWLDATRMGDENLDVLDAPNDHWGLPVREGGAGLMALHPRDPALPVGETTVKVDLTAGWDKAAKVQIVYVLRQDAGWAMNLAMSQASPADRDKALRAIAAKAYSWLQVDTVGFAYDPRAEEARITADGTGKPPFDAADGSAGAPQDWLIDASYLASGIELTRTGDYHRQARYQVAYPRYSRALVEVQLPDGGRGFEALNADPVDTTVAGVAYRRTAAVANGRFVMSASTHAVADSFPASEKNAVEPKLRQLADYPVNLRFNPSQAAAAPSVKAAAAPSPAATPLEEGEEAFRRRDFAAADTAFTRLLASAPSASAYYNRGAVRAAQGRRAEARADLRAALKIDPGHASADYALARLDLADGQDAAAEQGFRAALSASPAQRQPDLARRIAGALEEAHRYGAALPYMDRVLAAEMPPTARASALNERCWLAAEAGRELQRAQADCDQALTLQPGNASYLDSRGLVELRTGELQRAVDDYTAALTKRPGLATSVYGRSLAEARLGRASAADGDLQAVRRIDPEVEKTFAGWGVTR